MLAPLNHACILSSSHLLHFHRPRPVVLLHHEKNRVADWCDLNDLFYSELSELCAHNRKVNMNQFSLRLRQSKHSWCSDDQMCVHLLLCFFHPTQGLWAIDWMCFSGDPFGISVSSHSCTRAHRFHWSLLLFVSLCYRCKIKYTLQGLKQ